MCRFSVNEYNQLNKPKMQALSNSKHIQGNNIFELAMEHSGIGMALVGLDGSWLKVNQAACDLVGYTREELQTIDFQTITHPEDLEADLGYVKRLLKNEIQTYNMEKRYFHKYGHLIWVKLTVSLLRDDDGEPQYFISQIQDVSKEKKALKELVSAKKELEEFTYSVAHDLRTPLSSIASIMELLRQSINDGEYEDAQNTIEIAHSSLTKLSDLVISILDLHKVNLQEEQDKAVDVPHLVYSALDKFNHMKNFDRLYIETHFQYRGKLRGKTNRYMQIVENFISNAIKYQDLGEISSYIKISTYQKENEFVFEVEDNGLGISEENQKKLFQMFERFHPKAAFGTGLGLYMVKKSADILGGTISFSTPENNKGSIFRLSIAQDS